MHKYFLHLAYQGTYYSGWQRQRNTPNTVQEVLEKTMQEVSKERVEIYGCGRTDKGVHAAQFFAHFTSLQEWNNKLITILNHRLPPDIVVYHLIPVKQDQHTRYDAVQRRYDYFLHLNHDPFLDTLSAYYGDRKLDLIKMNEAMQLLRTIEDFGNMCLQPEKHNNTLCSLSIAQLHTSSDELIIRCTFMANRFLRGMIRIIMAKVLEVADGRLSMNNYMDNLHDIAERKHKDLAYAKGLYLSGVSYPFLDLPVWSIGYKTLLHSTSNAIDHSY